MYASDIVPELWELGYDLFGDRKTMKAQFLAADIFNPASNLKTLRNQMDIIVATNLFHLFSWDRQVEAACKMVSLSKPGTWLTGYHIGSELGREVPVDTGGKTGSAGSVTK